MKSRLLDVGVLLILATVALAIVIGSEAGLRSLAVHVYVFVVGGLAMGLVVAAAHDALPRRRSAFELSLGRRAAPAHGRPAQLERIEREVTLSVATAHDLHRKLLPQLQEIAECRLERAGKRAGPDTLGRWWELLRPDREEPGDRFGPGIAPADLRALVADLERL